MSILLALALRHSSPARLAPFAPVPFIRRDGEKLELVEHAEGTQSFGRLTAFTEVLRSGRADGSFDFAVYTAAGELTKDFT